MAKRFHHKTGTMVTLTNGEKTACRNNPYQEFNNGLVMSSEPLLDDQLFEVRIEKQVSTWSGSIEIGVTNLNPSVLNFPSSATNLREGSWVMSGTSILEDGKSQLEEYGHDLDELSEGDTVGVMRTSNGDLHFFVNSIDQGISAQLVTGTIYAVVDLYGKCAQVSIVEPDCKKGEFICASDVLHFHELCGFMVKLSNSKRTAERKKPVDEFNNGVVMTHRPLLDDELFEIRIDELVNKWSGSIEMGITTHNPEYLNFPATMTNMRSGTIMMSGCGILTNGKGSRREYGEYNLDELHEGDRIGLVKKSNKSLHYYINGLDQGIAAENVPDVIFGVVDLYGMTVKVSITDNFRPTINEPDSEISQSSIKVRSQPCPRIGLRYEDLLFHERCGLHVNVINNGRTAFRPNCLNDFNNAVVITNRPLKPGEIFEVLLEQVVMKWAGTIEIGVTMYSAEELNFPSTMTNVRSGTWMMTGNGIMYNGTTISDEYGYSLDKLKAGDKIGVVVYEDESLHFFINGIDQGLAATNVPSGIYGVIDLYGQAAKASIVHASESPTYYEDYIHPEGVSHFAENLQISQPALPSVNKKSPQAKKLEVDQVNDISRPRAAAYNPHLLYFDDGDDSLEEYSNDDIIEPPRSFHPVHGMNVSLDPIGIIATRNHADYQYGVVFSSKNLERDDLFEVQIYTMNDDWGGSLRFGVTTFDPENQMMLPPTALAFLGYDTWIIADSHFYKNGHIVKRNYAVYFPRVMAGDKIGVKIFNDDSLHFFINGADLGTAAVNMPKKLRLIADVYGAVESIMVNVNPSLPVINPDTKNTEKKCEVVTPVPVVECIIMAFHENHGRNIQLTNDNLTAARIASYNQGVVMSCKALQCNELFQIQIDNLHSEWSGSLQIGVTSQSPDQACLPISALSIRRGTWIISADSVFYNGIKVKSKYGPGLETLKSKHKIGIQLDQDKNLHLFVNGIDQGIAAEDIPHPAYAIVDVYGHCKQVTITSEAYSADEIEKDDKEKADVEYIGEKIIKPVCSSQLLPRNCDHQKLCSIVKTVFGSLDSYFLLESVTCFCEACHKLRGDEPYFKKGDPPKEYAQPFGWCRFPLRFATKSEKSGMNEKWHVAFHGTEFGSVRRILEHGKLLPPNMLGFKIRHKVADQGEKSKDTEDSLILITPTMRYAGSSKFSPKEDFVDSSTKKIYQAKVAFQVYVRPGSYTIGPQQLGVCDPIDVRFSNNDLEWYTKEENSVILHSLLMKVDPV